jgi:hypothetical protein
LSTARLQRANPLANNSPILRTSPKILEADGHYPPLGGQLHVSAAQPPPANIQMKMRKAPTAVPDSYSVGSSLPSGTPAAVRPATAGRAAEILIENARLEFRVNRRKQTFAIMPNRERMTLSFRENRSKQPARSEPPDYLAPGSILFSSASSGLFYFTEPSWSPLTSRSNSSLTRARKLSQ